MKVVFSHLTLVKTKQMSMFLICEINEVYFIELFNYLTVKRFRATDITLTNTMSFAPSSTAFL